MCAATSQFAREIISDLADNTHRSKLQSYPLDLVRTRLTAQTTDHYYQGIASTMRTIVRDEGMRGLYRGLGATLGQVTPALAVNYAAYESLRAYFMAAHPERETPSVNFKPHPPHSSLALQKRLRLWLEDQPM